MALDELRGSVLFQNSVDVWIAACTERGADWKSVDRYREFIRYLRAGGMGLKKYSLCVSDAESADPHEKAKAAFSEEIKGTGDPDAVTYTIRLDDTAIRMIRGFGQ